MALLEEFAQREGRLPWNVRPGEAVLYEWMSRARRYRSPIPDDVRARLAQLVETTPRVDRRHANRGHPSTLRAENVRRTARAARRTVRQAEAALARPRPDGWPQGWVAVLRARVADPEASLGVLAERTGLSKDQYAARLRRALEWHARHH